MAQEDALSPLSGPFLMDGRKKLRFPYHVLNKGLDNIDNMLEKANQGKLRGFNPEKTLQTLYRECLSTWDYYVHLCPIDVILAPHFWDSIVCQTHQKSPPHNWRRGWPQNITTAGENSARFSWPEPSDASPVRFFAIFISIMF